MCQCEGWVGGCRGAETKLEIAEVNGHWHASPAHAQLNVSEFALYEWTVDIFVCVPYNYACICMKPPYMLVEGKSC